MALVIYGIAAGDGDDGLCVMLGVVVGCCISGAYLYFILPKKRYKAMAKMKDAENLYVFGDGAVRVSSKSELYSGESEIEYTLFVRAYETSKYIFLYGTGNQVFIVEKLTVSRGTVEEVREKISSYLKEKYIMCKY